MGRANLKHLVEDAERSIVEFWPLACGTPAKGGQVLQESHMRAAPLANSSNFHAVHFVSSPYRTFALTLPELDRT
jgi:hypothetical protein